MKVCIIGDNSMKSDLILHEVAKEKFDDVFFAPVSGMRISLNGKGEVLYRTTDISKFDIIIPRIFNRESFFAYEMLNILPKNKYIAIRPVAYLSTYNRFFMFNYLRQEGIPTYKIHMAKTPSSAQRILDSMKFPITLRIPEAETVLIANTKQEAKAFVDTLDRLDRPILIEKKIPKKLYRLLVAGDEVVQSTLKIVENGDVIYNKGKIEKIDPTKKMKDLAIKTTKILNTDIARVDIAYDKQEFSVVNVVLKPSLNEIKEDSKAVASKILDELIRIYNRSHEPSFTRLFYGIKGTFRDVFERK